MNGHKIDQMKWNSIYWYFEVRALVCGRMMTKVSSSGLHDGEDIK